MNTTPRRALLVATAVLGLVVGIWAEFLHESFYADFPGFGLHWVATSGPFNEHLISDVGSAYLALSALSIAAIVARSAVPGRYAGLGWSVFGVLHLAFHVAHLEGSTVDGVGTVLSLGVSALLGLALLLPARKPRTAVAA